MIMEKVTAGAWGGGDMFSFYFMGNISNWYKDGATNNYK